MQVLNYTSSGMDVIDVSVLTTHTIQYNTIQYSKEQSCSGLTLDKHFHDKLSPSSSDYICKLSSIFTIQNLNMIYKHLHFL
jgi:hypothetical protein